MSRYAASTEVPVSRSRIEIEELLRRHGAGAFRSGWNESHDILEFSLQEKVIRFTVPRPSREPYLRNHYGHARPASAVQKSIEQADRQRWRALYLVIRAKLEAVESGIALFEQEFLAFVVLANGLTIGDVMLPALAEGRIDREVHLLTEGRIDREVHLLTDGRPS